MVAGDRKGEVTAVGEDNFERTSLDDSMPSEHLEFRWRLANGGMPLRERHLRSLVDYGVGSPMQSWMRTRLEYVLENHAFEHRNGVVHIVIEPDARVTFTVEPLGEVPMVLVQDLSVEGGKVTGASVQGAVWLVGDGTLTAMTEGKLIDAADTAVRDLAKTLHYEVKVAPADAAQVSAEGSEVFITNDEFGVLPLADHDGPTVRKFKEMLDRLFLASK